MKLKVNGIEVPVSGTIEVYVEVDDEGETLPNVNVNVTGGRLDVNASCVTKNGNIKIHPFRM